MFREIKEVRQEHGAGPRRWFESEGLELVVWMGQADEIAGFQLCYDLGRGEHALTWRAGAGFTHCAIDDGEATPFKNETPILIPEGIAPWADLQRLFDARSETLEPRLRNLVRETLVAQASADRRTDARKAR